VVGESPPSTTQTVINRAHLVSRHVTALTPHPYALFIGFAVAVAAVGLGLNPIKHPRWRVRVAKACYVTAAGLVVSAFLSYKWAPAVVVAGVLAGLTCIFLWEWPPVARRMWFDFQWPVRRRVSLADVDTGSQPLLTIETGNGLPWDDPTYGPRPVWETTPSPVYSPSSLKANVGNPLPPRRSCRGKSVTPSATTGAEPFQEISGDQYRKD
jgi:hypothetical protein